MENLFSTVAEISFTLLGFLILVFTIDTKSRKFWFRQYPQSRYAYINILFMIMPGFLALGGLLPSISDKLPAWVVVNIFAFIFYFLFTIELYKIKKSPEYKKISIYEERLDITKTAISNLVLLGLLTLIAIFAFVSNNTSIFSFAHFFFGFLLVSFIITGIVPVVVFFKVSAENKKKPRAKRRIG